MSRHQGSATLLVAALLAVGSLAGLALADVARVVVARAHATVAADAVALAAAPITFSSFGDQDDPARAAAAIAAANGVDVVECLCSIDRSWARRVVVAVVSIDLELLLLPDRRVEAAAAAEFRPILLRSG